MKKISGGLIALIIVIVCALGIFSFYKNTYNSMVSLDEDVSASWAEVQNQYQRRLDLIPNLVSTVKGYAKHESDVFTQVSQDNLGASLQRLLMVTEQYPELKADQNFLALQDQLEGTENRITVARNRFNDTAKKYNKRIRQFPANIIANMSGFEAHPYFSASAEAQSAPKVEF